MKAAPSQPMLDNRRRLRKAVLLCRPADCSLPPCFDRYRRRPRSCICCCDIRCPPTTRLLALGEPIATIAACASEDAVRRPAEVFGIPPLPDTGTPRTLIVCNCCGQCVHLPVPNRPAEPSTNTNNRNNNQIGGRDVGIGRVSVGDAAQSTIFADLCVHRTYCRGETMSRTVAIYSQQYDVCWGFLGVSWIESTAGGSENSLLVCIAKQC